LKVPVEPAQDGGSLVGVAARLEALVFARQDGVEQGQAARVRTLRSAPPWLGSAPGAIDLRGKKESSLEFVGASCTVYRQTNQ
jgi:hypothetical protein